MDKTSEADRMALRDGFAVAALIGLLAGRKVGGEDGIEDAYANQAFVFAEAMMQVRSKRPLP